MANERIRFIATRNVDNEEFRRFVEGNPSGRLSGSGIDVTPVRGLRSNFVILDDIADGEEPGTVTGSETNEIPTLSEGGFLSDDMVEALQHTMMENNQYWWSGEYHLSPIEPEKKKPERVCFKCKKELKFEEMVNANPDKDPEMLKDMWETKWDDDYLFQFYCCACFRTGTPYQRNVGRLIREPVLNTYRHHIGWVHDNLQRAYTTGGPVFNHTQREWAEIFNNMRKNAHTEIEFLVTRNGEYLHHDYVKRIRDFLTNTYFNGLEIPPEHIGRFHYWLISWRRLDLSNYQHLDRIISEVNAYFGLHWTPSVRFAPRIPELRY
jgi:hypothetical protein